MSTSAPGPPPGAAVSGGASVVLGRRLPGWRARAEAGSGRKVLHVRKYRQYSVVVRDTGLGPNVCIYVLDLPLPSS